MKHFTLLLISILFAFSSCRQKPEEQQQQIYNVVMDSIVVTKFSMTDDNGNPWDSSDNPDLQLDITNYSNSYIYIKTTPLVDVDNSVDRSFGLLNWQLGTYTEQDHTYTLRLLDNDNSYEDYMNQVGLVLKKNASPLSVISIDGRFEATVYYHH